MFKCWLCVNSLTRSKCFSTPLCVVGLMLCFWSWERKRGEKREKLPFLVRIDFQERSTLFQVELIALISLSPCDGVEDGKLLTFKHLTEQQHCELILAILTNAITLWQTLTLLFALFSLSPYQTLQIPVCSFFFYKWINQFFMSSHVSL